MNLEIHQNIKLAVDNVIFSIINDELHVLLIQMRKKPFEGMWALPGGFVMNGETVEAAAGRILKEETNVDRVYLEQLYTFSEIHRDPRRRVVSVAYMSLIHAGSQRLQTIRRYADIQWTRVGDIKKFAYDHSKILKYALQRLAWKIQYSNLAWSLLPREFTLSELQNLYEIVLGKKFDKRNFRKRIINIGLVEGTGRKVVRGAHRPAELFRFKTQKAEILDVV